MTTNIRSMDGTVQLVLSVETLERILEVFPKIETFEIPTTEDDIPTYGIRPKNL